MIIYEYTYLLIIKDYYKNKASVKNAPLTINFQFFFCHDQGMDGLEVDKTSSVHWDSSLLDFE
jgi:hypothetical protein